MSDQAIKRRAGFLDIGLGVFLLVICGSTIFEANQLPESDFEPLGPAFLPLWLSWGILILSAVVLFRGIKMVIKNPGGGVKPPAVFSSLAFYSVLLMVAYVAVMYFDILGYRTASIIFITALGYMLSHFQTRALITSLVIALITTFSTHYIFTKVLVIALP